MKISILASFFCIALLFSCRQTEPLKVAPDHPVTAHHGHREMVQAPDYPGLIEEYRTMLAEDPNNLSALIALGNAYYDIGKWKPAATMYEHALAIDPRNADVHTDRGTALRNLGLADQAVEEYRRALALDPGHLDARFNLGVVLAYDKNDGRAAIRVWKELLKLAPNYRNAQLIHEHIETMNQRGRKDAR